LICNIIGGDDMAAPLDQLTILIAEDQEHVREALSMLLRGNGYSVVLCSSPSEAMASAQQRPPDLAMIDMNYQRDSTSGLEGLQLIEQLRQLDGTVPIIALTAWGNVDLAVSAMKHGASDFIEKPWRNDSLLDKVRSLTGQLQQRRSSQRISDYEREDAQQLQARIVPRRHVVAEGIELVGESTPAGVVGGDYFGVWQPTADSVHFCVADVSGKGTPGAMIAAMLYASLSTLSVSNDSPDFILDRLETILRNQLGEGHYVTIFYGVFDVKSRILSFVNAGHCPPILRHADGSVESLASTRPVLGLIMGAGFHSERLRLSAGDRLLLYTDGVTEAGNDAGEEFGAERLASALECQVNGPLLEQLGNIMGSVRGHAQGNFGDDATLLLISVSPGSSSAVAKSSVQIGSIL
jgi:serine phosphatase RsbU (regulator of sigma subunit)